MIAKAALGCLFIGWTLYAAAADVGRLFFTPTQRAILDNARRMNRIDPGKSEEAPAPVPQNLSVSGLVRRSDGKSTVWINDRTVTESQKDGIRIAPGKSDNRVRLTVPDSGLSIDLKVGQTVEIMSGTIEEGYRRAPPPKPEPKPTAAPTNKPDEAANVTPPAATQSVESKVAPPKKSERELERDLEEAARRRTVPAPK